MLALPLLSLALAAETPNVPVVPGATAPTWLIAGGKGTARLLIGPTTGAPEAALNHLVLAPGAEIALHTHDASAELLYVEAGRVELTIAGVTVQAGPGDAVHIPAGVPHSARILGRHSPLQAVQVYVGPGPEARFTTGERATEE